MTDADFSGAPGERQDTRSRGIEPGDAEPDRKLAEVQAEAEKLREDWLRAKAETENVRRRSQEDLAKAHRFAVEGFASAMLPVKDSLDAALTVENPSVESYREGVEITARQLASVFEKFALREIDPAGEKFDPHRHQAISQVESEKEPNTVVTVLQKGYLLHDRVIRPALVIVSKARSESEENPPAA